MAGGGMVLCVEFVPKCGGRQSRTEAGTGRMGLQVERRQQGMMAMAVRHQVPHNRLTRCKTVGRPGHTLCGCAEAHGLGSSGWVAKGCGASRAG